MPPKTRRRAIICVAAAILAGILFFGLGPKDLTLTNQADWLKIENGLQIRKYGIVFSPPFIDPGGLGSSGRTHLTVELAIKTIPPPSDHFSCLLVLDNGDDSKQLLLGQWRSWLILMNGDDYAHKKNLKRLSVNTETLPEGILHLVILVGGGETRFYCNGEAEAVRKDFSLKVPAGRRSRVIIGNTAYGKHSWRGNIYGLAIYDHLLSGDTISAHYRLWSRERHFGYALQDNPMAVYAFDEKQGQRARDLAGPAHLQLPRRMKVLRRQVLAPPWKNFKYDRDFIIDALLNIFGFIPLAFITTALLQELGGRLKTRAYQSAVTACVAISLFIEMAQSWLPSRSSTMLDLVLNSLGAIAGAALYGIYQKRRLRAKP